MNKPLKVPTALCKQVNLQLVQSGLASEVGLAGDCVLQECLLLVVSQPFEAEEAAVLQVQFFAQNFDVQGIVNSCQPHSHHEWLVSFRLHDADDLKTRMLLQLSRMEQYRNEMAAQGRELSIDEAACEWIGLYAEQFAKEFDAGHNKEVRHG